MLSWSFLCDLITSKDPALNTVTLVITFYPRMEWGPTGVLWAVEAQFCGEAVKLYEGCKIDLSSGVETCLPWDQIPWRLTEEETARVLC